MSRDYLTTQWRERGRPHEKEETREDFKRNREKNPSILQWFDYNNNYNYGLLVPTAMADSDMEASAELKS